MNYGEFIHEFDDVIQAFGAEAFPRPVLDRMFYKTQDLSQSQLKELCVDLIDTCKFAPKVPDVIERANIVRARHREGIRGDTYVSEGPSTPEVGKKYLAQIHDILSKTKGPK